MSRPRHVRWPWQLAALALALLTLGVGLCLFDCEGTDSDSHAARQDLCGGVLTPVGVVTLLALAAVSRVLAEPALALAPITLHRLDPPPRSLHLS